MCGYKMGDVSPPARSAKLKIIYGSKTSKTAYLDYFHSNFLHPHVLCMWLVATLKGGRWPAFKGGECPPAPLNETLTMP